jgi:hypothetical protein
VCTKALEGAEIVLLACSEARRKGRQETCALASTHACRKATSTTGTPCLSAPSTLDEYDPPVTSARVVST